jgi:nucleotide-binding universal stress UspA family protein
MIKGKPAYPFHTIALAVSFAPGLEFLVRETKRHCDIHAAMAIFVHAGKKTGDKFRELSTILTSAGFHDGNSRIYWEQGGPVNSVLQVCKHEVVDLLLIGASDKADFGAPVGNFSREIAAKAKCSVLMYANRDGSFRRIVVNGQDHRKTEQTILTTFYIGESEKAEEIIIAEENDNHENSQITVEAGINRLSPEVRSAMGRISSEIIVTPISSEGTSSLSDFAFRKGADLLVVNSTDHHLRIFDRIYSNEIDSVMKQLPCNLMIVHSRLPEE